MPAFQFFHEFKKHLGDGTIDLDGHTFKVMLSNTAPDLAANTVKADITEISAGNGYSAGGATAGSVTWTETGAGTGVWRFNFADVTFTASGGAIATFRYVILYDDTPTSPADPLVGMWDHGAAVNITDGNQYVVDIQSQGVFELA